MFSGAMPAATKASYWEAAFCSRVDTGYGYQTWRALIGLLVILVAGAGLGLGAGHTRSSPTQYVATHTRATASPGTPSGAGPGVQKTAPTVVLLGNQNRAVTALSLPQQGRDRGFSLNDLRWPIPGRTFHWSA